MGGNAQDGSLNFIQVAIEEREAITSSIVSETPKTNRELTAFLHREQGTALCLSGGGIRSATVSLGVLQGLARLRLLTRFDYLSTVSGGGYIGSWLTAWAHNERANGGIEHVQDEIASKDRDDEDRDGVELAEQDPVLQLRRHSNYLSPRTGVLSADTWTLAATFLRNLLLNWMVLVPVLLIVVSLPAICWSVVGVEVPAVWVLAALGVGIAAGALSMFGFGRSIPDEDGSTSSRAEVLGLCVAPLFISSICYTTAWGWRDSALKKLDGDWPGRVLTALSEPWGLALAAAVFGAIGCVAGCRVRIPVRKTKACGLLAVAAFLVAYSSLWCSMFLYEHWGSTAPNWWFYVCLATPVYLGTVLTITALLVSPLIQSTDDLSREWITRIGAWVLVSISGWTLFSLAAVFGPELIRNPGAAAGVAAAGGLSGSLTAILGYSAKTAANSLQEKLDSGKISLQTLLGKVLAPAFLIALLVGLSALEQWIYDWLCALAPWFAMLPQDAWRYGLLVAVAAAAGFLASCYVDSNKFSLHGMYRNRLIRAYLGASRKNRRSDPFTDFDKADNIWLKDLKISRPFHVINAALNLTGGRRLEWAERKAESFTFSRLHAGAAGLGYRHIKSDNGACYGGKNGVSLGTAVAVSGAAVNSNMGYNSSPLVTFLLTLLNARLGWWLGNPSIRGKGAWHLNGPRFSLGPLLSEAFGMTNDERRYVNLSDGGHFENLGLYEMVRRRCRYIVVVDASADPEYTFEDLANAIRKVRIDFGISITIDTSQIHPKKGRPKAHWAKGVIHYKKKDPEGQDGELLYLKPVLTGDEERDIQSYRLSSRDFPHESTADQFFSESQFESYRALGLHTVEQPVPGIPVFGPLSRVSELFDKFPNLISTLPVEGGRAPATTMLPSI